MNKEIPTQDQPARDHKVGHDEVGSDNSMGSNAPVSAVASTDAACAATRTGWPLERVLFAMAGTMTLVSIVLALLFPLSF